MIYHASSLWSTLFFEKHFFLQKEEYLKQCPLDGLSLWPTFPFYDLRLWSTYPPNLQKTSFCCFAILVV